MSGADSTHAPESSGRETLADLCGEVKERLGTIAQTLAQLREEIDAALRDTTTG